MELKCGRTVFELNNKDVIMYNGAVFQLITRKVGYGWEATTPIVAKAKARKLIKDGLLKKVELEKPPYKDDSLEYYKIN